MANEFTNEPLLEMFIFETSQQIEQLEKLILDSEKECSFTLDMINEIFRIMHTIKGSAAMMMFQNISSLAHSMEDIFFYLREDQPEQINYIAISDLVLEAIDFIKLEIEKIKNNVSPDGTADSLEKSFRDLLETMKNDNRINLSNPSNGETEYANTYKATIFFEENCQMENIRAVSIIQNLKEITDEIKYFPEDIIENDDTKEMIQKEGFHITLKCNLVFEEMKSFFEQTVLIDRLELNQIDSPKVLPCTDVQGTTDTLKDCNQKILEKLNSNSVQQSLISVSVLKLDRLLDLVGEMVISEAMVTQNPDLQGLQLDNFNKAARQLNKITGEMQDIIMSIRMVPLAATFQKMNRIVRDMCKKLNKEVALTLVGEETEVDKNIIEHISDPLMHLVRNSIDHGIETIEERMQKGKSRKGTVILEAKNAGSDVLIIVKDDGGGLDRKKILEKARENNLLHKKSEDMSDKEVYNLILLPGFSTNSNITEYSGRGVGMDVVAKNIEQIGGSLAVESELSVGTTIILKIPLTLAIIDGMTVRVGQSLYTIPITSIKESFKPCEQDIIADPDGNESILVRGTCYPILRLHRFHDIETNITDFEDGIIIIIEQDDKSLCIFVDELIGQQQVVVKSLPQYIQNFKSRKGIAGCTLLGDGSISLIMDVSGIMNL